MFIYLYAYSLVTLACASLNMATLSLKHVLINKHTICDLSFILSSIAYHKSSSFNIYLQLIVKLNLSIMKILE